MKSSWNFLKSIWNFYWNKVLHATFFWNLHCNLLHFLVECIKRFARLQVRGGTNKSAWRSHLYYNLNFYWNIFLNACNFLLKFVSTSFNFLKFRNFLKFICNLQLFFCNLIEICIFLLPHLQSLAFKLHYLQLNACNLASAWR